MVQKDSVLPYFKKLIKEKIKSLPITDEKMTRFWISIDDGVDFVLKSIELMYGGELFIPKMPSIKILDLAASLKKDFKYHIIGIRLGKKFTKHFARRTQLEIRLNLKNILS